MAPGGMDAMAGMALLQALSSMRGGGGRSSGSDEQLHPLKLLKYACKPPKSLSTDRRAALLGDAAAKLQNPCDELASNFSGKKKAEEARLDMIKWKTNMNAIQKCDTFEQLTDLLSECWDSELSAQIIPPQPYQNKSGKRCRKAFLHAWMDRALIVAQNTVADRKRKRSEDEEASSSKGDAKKPKNDASDCDDDSGNENDMVADKDDNLEDVATTGVAGVVE